MTMQAIVTQEVFDAFPDHYKSEYNQDPKKTDIYLLDVSAVNGVELADTTALRGALEKERGGHKTTTTKLTDMTKLFDGLDPEAARKAIDQIAVMDDWDPDEKLKQHKEDFEAQVTTKANKQLAAMEAKHKTEMDTSNVTITKQRKKMTSSMIDAAAVKALSEAGGSSDLLLPLIQKSTRVVEDGDDYVVEVFNEHGQRISPASTDPMSIKEFVAEMKNDQRYARAFDGSGASGGGASGSQGKGGSSAPYTITASEADDHHAYKTAKENAAKAGRELQILE